MFGNKAEGKLAITSQYYIGNFSQCNNARKIKGIQIGKNKIKLSLLTDDLICQPTELKKHSWN